MVSAGAVDRSSIYDATLSLVRPGVSYLWAVLAVVVQLSGNVHGSLTAMHRDELVILLAFCTHQTMIATDSYTVARSTDRLTAHKS